MGLVASLHGLMKLLKGPEFWQTLGGMPAFVPDIPWLQASLGTAAMLIELLGGLMVTFGIKVRYACFSLMLVLLVAFAHHLVNVDGFISLMLNSWPMELVLVFAFLAWTEGKALRQT